jgi:hypothetical protein
MFAAPGRLLHVFYSFLGSRSIKKSTLSNADLHTVMKDLLASDFTSSASASYNKTVSIAHRTCNALDTSDNPGKFPLVSNCS